VVRILVLAICIACFCSCQLKSAEQKKIKNDKASVDSIDFKTRIQPILQKNCVPCHFPGGKLYERLPFDKAGTIINHEAGVLKRFKNEADINLVKQFVRQHRDK
jgi:hypothetical protein